MKPNSREAKRIVPLFPKSGNSKSPKKRAQHGIPQNLPFGSLPGNSNQNRSSSVIPSGPPQKKRKTSLAYQEEKKPSRFEYPKFTQNQFENSDFILEEEETEEKNMMNYFNISSNIPQTNNFRFNPVNPQYSSSLISSRIETSQLQSEIAKVRVKITEPDSKVVSEFCFNQSSLATLSVTQIVKDVSWVDGNPILRFRPSFPLFFIEVLGQVKQILKSPTEESSNYHLYLVTKLFKLFLIINCKFFRLIETPTFPCTLFFGVQLLFPLVKAGSII